MSKKDLKIIKIKGKDEAVFGNNKKTIGFKNHVIAEVIYDNGILPINAVDNAVTVTGTTGATNVINVLTNDTLGGAAATVSNVTLSVVTANPKLTLNLGTGALSVVNPTTAGVYTMVYKIVQKDRPTNGDTATVTVTVTA